METIASEAKTNEMLRRAFNAVSAIGIKLIVKLVGIGRYADTSLMVRCKLACQTVNVWELTPVHYARKRKKLPTIIEQLVGISTFTHASF